MTARSLQSLSLASGVLCLGLLGVALPDAPRGREPAPMPGVRVVWPEDGAVLGGEVSVFVPNREDLGVSRVELLLDVSVLLGAVPGGVYAIAWDTRDVPEGPHTLTARVYDTSGRTASSAPVRVTVGPPLTVTLSPPAPGEGAPRLTAVVAHARGPAWVQFLTEERFLCGVEGPPYTCPLSTSELLVEGTRVRAEVYDAQGNHALSEWMPLAPPPERTASTLGLELPVGRGLGR